MLLLLLAASTFAAENGNLTDDSTGTESPLIISTEYESDTQGTTSEISIESTTEERNGTEKIIEASGPTTDIEEMTTEPDGESAIVVKANRIKCRDGLILPCWRPLENITLGDRFSRGLVYFLLMCYLFLGVSIVSDSFMAAIEKITAIEKEVVVRKADGSKQTVVVRVWNETVANLTLMALGNTITVITRLIQPLE